MRNQLNGVKGREPFRPFGLTAFEDVAARLVGHPTVSPAMLVARTLIDPETVAAAVHVDGTCRIQTVSRCASTALAEILRIWERETGLGALLNTSFNEAGQPIIERPPDAISTAAEMGITLCIPESAGRSGMVASVDAR